MNRHFCICGIMVVAVAIAGCARVGSRSRHGISAPLVGDFAYYSMSLSRDASVAAANGSRNCEVLSGANHGRSLPAFITATVDFRTETVLDTSAMGKPLITITWLGLDAAGNLYLLGESEDGVSWDVVADASPPVYIPHRIAPGVSWKYEAHFASGVCESATQYCGSTEIIKTPLGDRNAYKVNTTVLRKGTTTSGYVWLSSDLPWVLEVAGDVRVTSDSSGIPMNAHVAYQMDKVRLASAK